MYKDRAENSGNESTAAAQAMVLRREELIAAIRLSRAISMTDLLDPGAVIDFPTTLVIGAKVHDLHLSHSPGLFATGVHTVDASVTIDGVDVFGSFTVAVGDQPQHGLLDACWQARTRAGAVVALPPEVAAQLPRSIAAPSLSPVLLVGRARRIHLCAERSRSELIEANRGLVLSVVNRYRAVVRAESAALDMSDLVVVAEQQLLTVVDRYFSDPHVTPVRDVAWSKLVQRAIGNALRSEIARATGVSVEFRQLLMWLQTHPEHRSEDAALVARHMSFAAGVTRLMSKRSIRDRFAAIATLEAMLANGEAEYVSPGKGAAERARLLGAKGVFVISSRSSLAEIERAQQFATSNAVRLDADTEKNDRSGHLASREDSYDEVDWLDVVKNVIEESGLTELEALVWLHRSGALDPGGYGTELPEIAEDLGLDGRSEARAALRRARRKLDSWAVEHKALDLVS